MVTALIEADLLVECELQIEQGLSSYVKVGRALDQIRANRAYDKVDPNFKRYCARRWGWSEAKAWHWITASRVAGKVDKILSPPTSLYHAHLLVPLLKNEKGLLAVWAYVLKHHPDSRTGGDISAVVERYLKTGGVDVAMDQTTSSRAEPIEDPTPGPTAAPAQNGAVGRELLPPVMDSSQLLPGQQEKARYSRPAKTLRTRLFEIVQAYPSTEAARDVADQIAASGFDLSPDDCRRLSSALSAAEHGRRALKQAIEARRPRRRRRN